jgi:hypothetical protein
MIRRILPLLLGLTACAAPAPPAVPPDERSFREALDQYRDVLGAGFDLRKPGAGQGPISHVSLFKDYAHVFYLPEPADRLVLEKRTEFLQAKSRSPDPETAALATACLEILRSPRKLRRSRTYRWSSPVEVALVLHHYD